MGPFDRGPLVFEQRCPKLRCATRPKDPKGFMQQESHKVSFPGSHSKEVIYCFAPGLLQGKPFVIRSNFVSLIFDHINEAADASGILKSLIHLNGF